MAFLNSLKKLFGTSKEVTEQKTAEFKEKTEDTIEKLDEKAAAVVDKIEVKLRSRIEKPVEKEATPASPAPGGEIPGDS